MRFEPQLLAAAITIDLQPLRFIDAGQLRCDQGLQYDKATDRPVRRAQEKEKALEALDAWRSRRGALHQLHCRSRGCAEDL